MQDLNGFTEADTSSVKRCVWMLDACTVQQAILKHDKKLAILLELGNFRIVEPVLQELRAWRKPFFLRKQAVAEWEAVQVFITNVELNWPGRIVPVMKHPIAKRLHSLSPLISKVLVYNLVLTTLPIIWNQLFEIDFEKLCRLSSTKFHGVINVAWRRELHASSRFFDLRVADMKNEEVAQIGRNRNIELRALLGHVYRYAVNKGFGQAKLKAKLEKDHKVKLETDIQIVLLYLTSNEDPKRLPPKDKDIWELVLLYKYAKFKF